MNYQKENKLFYTQNLLFINSTLFIKGLLNLILFLILKKIIGGESKDKFNGSILLINSEKMGDVTICLDFINSIVSSRKYSKVFVLINENVAPLLKETNINIEIISYNHLKFRYNLLYRIRIIRNIRKLSLEYVANISPERGSINDVLTILSGAKFKIGLKSKSIYITSTFTKYYNKYYSFFSNSKLKNEYYALDDLLRYFNIDKRDNDKLFYCEENNFTPRENYILIAPSASESFRNWDKANFRILIQKLCDVKSHPIIIIGTFRQSGIIKYISEGIDNTTIKIDLHFSEIIQLVYNCRLLVGLDSGITHIALQMRKPIIAIIGGGKYGKFFPYKNTSYVRYFYHEMDCFGCNWICKYKEPYCLTMVSVDDVFSSCNQLLDMK